MALHGRSPTTLRAYGVTMTVESTAGAESAEGCFACGLIAGDLPLAGGVVHRAEHWIVEHAVGPLELGTLVVKPIRHVCHVADLNDDESVELGPLLRLASSVVTELCDPDQVYACLWSHKDARPGHIHFVIEPVVREAVVVAGATGPTYQAIVFARGAEPDVAEIDAFCDRARAAFDRRAAD